MRDWQNRSNQFLAGKAWERSSPIGPLLVTPEELPRGAEGLRITCSVNDEVVQDDSTSDLLFGVAALIADISTFTSLAPGDIIATGTPGGVGAGRTPPRFLAPGDRLRTSIEGIGELDNLIASE
jgi:acylpyruvate hydrolase